MATELSTNAPLWSKQLRDYMPISAPYIYHGAVWVSASRVPLEVWDLTTGVVITQYDAIGDYCPLLGLAVFEGKFKRRYCSTLLQASIKKICVYSHSIHSPSHQGSAAGGPARHRDRYDVPPVMGHFHMPCVIDIVSLAWG